MRAVQEPPVMIGILGEDKTVVPHVVDPVLQH